MFKAFFFVMQNEDQYHYPSIMRKVTVFLMAEDVKSAQANHSLVAILVTGDDFGFA